MALQGIHAEKLSPQVGAEIHGVDLSRPLDEPTFKAVHDCLIDNGVIFFRDQRLTPDEQKEFGRSFGELPVPLPLAAALRRVLGQPLCPAPRAVGLLPAAAARAPRDGEGRQAFL
jgi:alpha-ketoglutarate-dependent taurine dioxygenase